MISASTTLDEYASGNAPVCRYCGGPLRTVRVEVCGKVWHMPDFGSCGCKRSAEEIGLEKPVVESIADKRMKHGVPQRYADVAPDDVYLNYVLAGSGMYIYGNQGTGKTTMACGIANGLSDRGLGVRFYSVTSLMQELRNDKRRGPAYDEATTAPYLVLDDIGQELPTGWAMSMLYDVINERYSNMLPTIYTSNYDLGGLASRIRDKADPNVAASIVSRIRETCMAYRMIGNDGRLS